MQGHRVHDPGNGLHSGPTFGARLRLQREQRQVSLATIADDTKIKLSLLEGLERDDVSQWPGGIFRRAYVRAYAHAIGLDPDDVLREFLELFPEPVEETAAAVAAARDAASGGRRPPMRLKYLIESAINALPSRRPSAADRAEAPPVTERETAGASRASDEVPGRSGDFSVDTAHAYDIESPAAPAPGPELPFEPPVGRSDEDGEDDPALLVDLSAVAHLCTWLARIVEPSEIEPLLQEAARVLRADGLILWMWDKAGRVLRPVLSHGYAADVVRRLPNVPMDEDNAIAESFRSAELRIVEGNAHATGAVVAPIVPPRGCVGVLAFELRNGREQLESVHAVATILAAQLSSVVGQSGVESS